MDGKLPVGLQRDDIVRRIANPKQRKMLQMLEKLSKESPGECSELTNSCARKSPDVRSACGSVSAAVTIFPNSTVSIVNDLQDASKKTDWSDLGMNMIGTECYLTWNARFGMLK